MICSNLKTTKTAAVGWLFVLLLPLAASGQAKRRAPSKPAAKPAAVKTAPGPAEQRQSAGPAVTLVDDAAFRKLLVPKGRPLMINFWATWCGPCREEFPDLVKLNNEYKERIDFITVTLDFEEELNTGVPKFLTDMKATMPTFLLVTPDETAAISAVSKEWAGALPFTVIYEPKGALVYFHQGVVKPDDVKATLNKLLAPAPDEPATP